MTSAAVQLLALDAANDLAAVHDLFDVSYRPTAQALDADGNLRLAGNVAGAEGFTAAVDLNGTVLWSQTSADMLSATLEILTEN